MDNNTLDNQNFPWINPIGGFGDMMMLSGVLFQIHKKNPKKKFNLVRRSRYQYIFENHPAIACIGNPPESAEILETMYWAIEILGPGSQRPFQILARHFGAETPMEETLYFPARNENESDLLCQLTRFITEKRKPLIAICPGSDSPRKMMAPEKWHNLVELLTNFGATVFQIGQSREIHIRNAYSLLGITSPREVVYIAELFDVIITSDNFLMHVAHLYKKPAVVLWGPTRCDVYGYPEQVHCTTSVPCDCIASCLGPKFPENYARPCKKAPDVFCMNLLSVEDIFNDVRQLLQRAKNAAI